MQVFQESFLPMMTNCAVLLVSMPSPSFVTFSPYHIIEPTLSKNSIPLNPVDIWCPHLLDEAQSFLSLEFSLPLWLFSFLFARSFSFSQLWNITDLLGSILGFLLFLHQTFLWAISFVYMTLIIKDRQKSYKYESLVHQLIRHLIIADEFVHFSSLPAPPYLS